MAFTTMEEPLIPYVVRQGDYLTKLAYRMGFDAQEVWKHSKNADLAALRMDPDVLQPGDILHVPAPKRPRLPIDKGAINRYVATVPKVTVTVTFQEADGTPIANEGYELHGLPGAPPGDATDGEGKVTLTLPVLVREVDVFFPRRNEVYRLGVGDMDPHAEVSGVRKRLENLGYLVPRPWAPDEGTLTEGLRYFQRDQGLEPTGMLDDATRQALEDAHGA